MKKSFYKVGDQVTLSDLGQRTVSVKLINCNDSIPIEKRAYNFEALGVRIFGLIDVRTNILFQTIDIDNKFILEIEGDETVNKLTVGSPDVCS